MAETPKLDEQWEFGTIECQWWAPTGGVTRHGPEIAPSHVEHEWAAWPAGDESRAVFCTDEAEARFVAGTRGQFWPDGQQIERDKNEEGWMRHARATPSTVREVTLPDLRLHGNQPVVVRRCFYNGSATTPTNDPSDSLALRYRYACDPPEWYRLTEKDMARCSGDDFRALATLSAPGSEGTRDG